MAEEIESNSGKKRRIIHWNPDAGNEQVRRKWTLKRILLWSVGGFFGVLFTAAIVIRGAKLVFGPEIFEPKSAQSAAGPTVADANSAFISQAKAEQLHEIVAKALNELRRMPADHPMQLQQMILMEKNFQQGEALLADHEFSKAYVAFDG